MHHSHDRGDYHTVICSWLTGTSPILVLLQGPDGSIYCHDVYRGRLYLVAHSVSLFARLGLRHCEPLYAAPRWKHVPLPSMWVASPPASATLTQTLAVSATHGLDALYSLLKIHRGTPCSLIHPVNGYVLDMILTGRSFQEAPCQNTRTSVKTTPHVMDAVCGGRGSWLSIGYLVKMPHIHLAVTRTCLVTAIDVRQNFLWRVADDALLFLVTGSLLLLSRPTADLTSWSCLQQEPVWRNCLDTRGEQDETEDQEMKQSTSKKQNENKKLNTSKKHTRVSSAIPTFPLSLRETPPEARSPAVLAAATQSHKTRAISTHNATTTIRIPRLPSYLLEARLLSVTAILKDTKKKKNPASGVAAATLSAVSESSPRSRVKEQM